MKNLRRILSLLSLWKWHFFGSGFLLVAGIFIRMLEPKVFQVAIDHVALMSLGSENLANGESDFVIRPIVKLLASFENADAKQLLLVLAGLYLVISLFRAVFVFIAKTINAWATEKSVELLRNTFFSHLQKLPMSYFPTISTGELIQRSTGDIETIRRFIGNQTVEVLRLTAIFVFSSYWLFTGNLIFGLISIAIVPFIGISGYIFFKKEQKVWRKHEDEADKLNAITQENISGIRVVKAFAQEMEEMEKFGKQNLTKLKVALQHAKLHTIFWPLSDFLVHLQIIVSIFVGGYMAINQIITPGELVSFYTYIIMVAWPLRQVGRLLSDMGMALVAMERIQTILDAPEEKDLAALGSNLGVFKKIELRNVWFTYEGDNEPTIKGVNLTIEPGDTIAILGPTGSGKSTLAKLLLRFYEPQQGEILINAIPIKQIPKKWIRKKVGLILQQAFLFTDTVKGNMSYAQDKVEDNTIHAVSRMAGLEEIETVFTDGFNTMVGEKGVTLSGGQKQRVSIARTMIQAPDVLILDDVTSAVDAVTESNILGRLKNELEEQTTIIITHRLTAVPYVDKIVIMEEGAISAIGSHKELIANSHFYQQIHAIQNIVEGEIDALNNE